MKRRPINSIFVVEHYEAGKKERITVTGDGQEAISFLRKQYPESTKFVLVGFEVDGNIIPVTYPNFYYDKRN